jgi:hypothetical protein
VVFCLISASSSSRSLSREKIETRAERGFRVMAKGPKANGQKESTLEMTCKCATIRKGVETGKYMEIGCDEDARNSCRVSEQY